MFALFLIATGLFVAGYITARYSLIAVVSHFSVRAWEDGVLGRLGKGFIALTVLFALLVWPIERIASREVLLKPQGSISISAREQLRRRGSI